MSDQCQVCSKSINVVLEYKDFSYVKPCVIKDSKGNYRESLEAVFINGKNVCYCCYKFLVKKYLKLDNSVQK